MVDAIDLPGIIDNRDVQLAHKTLFFYLLIFVTLGSHILEWQQFVIQDIG